MEQLLSDDEIKALAFKALNPDATSQLSQKVRKPHKFKLDYVKILHDVSEKVQAICSENIPLNVHDMKPSPDPVCGCNNLMTENSSSNDSIIIID